jgi:hypothetical protein
MNQTLWLTLPRQNIYKLARIAKMKKTDTFLTTSEDAIGQKENFCLTWV